LDPFESEDQEFEKVREWWKKNGSSTVAGLVIGAALVFGNNWWKDYRVQRAENASKIFEQMMIQNASKQTEAAQKLGGRLMKDYAATPYAGKGALFIAHVSYQTGDIDNAQRQLQWAIDNAIEPSTVHVARLRLARILEDKGELDAALKLVRREQTGGYTAQYLELEADLLAAQGDTSLAREKYRKALASLAPGLTDAQRVIRMKLDDMVEAG